MFKKLFEFIRKLLSKFDLVEKNQVNYMFGKPLPEPLNIEQERELLLKVKQGDEAAREKLIEHNLRLVIYIAKKFEGSVNDVQDLVSVGAIGLIKAVNSFNLDKNIKLATFASRCIENEILMYLRKVVRWRCEVSLDEPLNTDSEGNELLLSDVIGTDSDVIPKSLEQKTEVEALYRCFEQLSQREAEIIKLRYGLYDVEEKTQKEIADMLGISQSYISRLEKKVLNKLRKEMSKYV